ncbi:MAG TPA: SDR family oxidoreductase [Rugosimonospora sp.]|nr:SDR family oxidoreductase [Rugosimonospora sp.]
MTSPLHGRTVLVTGAARGIGEHVARLAAARGARLSLVGLEPQRLASLAEQLSTAGPGHGPHLWFECDVTDQHALDAAARSTVEATGRIDAVVANAGIANIGTVAVSDPDALVRTIDVNLNGVVRTVAATLPYVRTSRGYFLLVSSAAAFTALPGMAAYCAAKAGVEQFGNVLRQETAHLGVRVGTAHPSWVDTDLVRDIRQDLSALDTSLRKLPWPLGGTVSVGECAQAIVQGLEQRRRRIYIPRAIGAVQAARTLVLSPLADAIIRPFTRGIIPALEAEARALGRSFGVHSTGKG